MTYSLTKCQYVSSEVYSSHTQILLHSWVPILTREWLNKQALGTEQCGIKEVQKRVALEMYVDPLCLLKISAHISLQLNLILSYNNLFPIEPFPLNKPQ